MNHRANSNKNKYYNRQNNKKRCNFYIMKKTWTPKTWQKHIALQQPKWENKISVKKVIDEITTYPPLVFAGEVRTLKQQLAEAAQGKGFLIQGGDCAETFDAFNANAIRDK